MKKIWFKRKWFGWGWYPATWEGWVTTLVYALFILLFAKTLDSNSSAFEVIATFILPVALLTFTFIRIAMKTGERPRWQWRWWRR